MNREFDTPEEAAKAAAQVIAQHLIQLIESQGRAVIIIDCASRPRDFFTGLTAREDVDWTQVIVFQASEFLGEGSDSRSSCQRFLTEHLISRVPIVSFYPMRGDAPNPKAAVDNLSNRYQRTPADIAFLSTELLEAVNSEEHTGNLIGDVKLNGRRMISFSTVALEQCAIFVYGEPREGLSVESTPRFDSFTYKPK